MDGARKGATMFNDVFITAPNDMYAFWYRDHNGDNWEKFKMYESQKFTKNDLTIGIGCCGVVGISAGDLLLLDSKGAPFKASSLKALFNEGADDEVLSGGFTVMHSPTDSEVQEYREKCWQKVWSRVREWARYIKPWNNVMSYVYDDLDDLEDSPFYGRHKGDIIQWYKSPHGLDRQACWDGEEWQVFYVRPKDEWGRND